MRSDLNAGADADLAESFGLTPEEFALLEYLTRHADQVVARTGIAGHVRGMNFDTFTNVINVSIRYLRREGDEPFARRRLQPRRGFGCALAARPDERRARPRSSPGGCKYPGCGAALCCTAAAGARCP